MKTLLFVLSLLLIPAASHAQWCAPKVSSPSSVNPSQPLLNAARTWLQWLNGPSGFTCTGNSSHYTCSRAGYGPFNFYAGGCSGTTCFLSVYDPAGWRNSASYVVSGGQAWGFDWDVGTGTGWLTQTCVPDTQHLGQMICSYGTCFQ